MIISHKHRVVFIAVPKTGTRTIQSNLTKNYAGQLYGGEHNTVVPASSKSYFTFLVKRNPYDRFISMWWATCQREGNKYVPFKSIGKDNPLALAKWMQKTNKKSKLLTRQSEYHKENRIDAILDFESLEEDFNKLPFVSEQLKGHANGYSQFREPWESYMTDELASVLNSYYKTDFDLLGYKKF
jgi:hypothetical protein